MPSNFTEFLFAFLAITVMISSLLVHTSSGFASKLFKNFLFYGKCSEPNVYKIFKHLEIPKRWFKHFYIVAVPVTSVALILAVNRYFYNNKIPSFIHFILDLQFGHSRKPVVTPESTMIALVLLHVQCWKRLYETLCVSVYSDAKMNLSHYIAGFIHYIGATTCIIGESFGFVTDSSGMFHWNKLKLDHLICSIIFLLASYEQLRTNYILANLRKDDSGIVVTKSYKIPHKRLFEYISAPLQFTELIMYLMLTIILRNASSFHYVFLWVLINQTETALSTHRWLRKTFVKYPTGRKIYIPFLI